MKRRTTQWKLGLLVLCVTAAIGATAIILGLHSGTTTVRYHTYIDESVSGLSTGSVVDFRGVRIGSVGPIEIAPDRRRIDVALDLTTDGVAQLGLASRALGIRARLSSSGITGVKYIDLEPADAEGPAEGPPALGFEPAARYIPARQSFLQGLEERAERIEEQVPALVEHMNAAADKVVALLDDLQARQVAARFGVAVQHIDAAVGDVRRFMGHLDRAELPSKAGAVLAQLDAAATKVHAVMAKVEGDGELEQAMRELGGAARAFRQLVQEVEREPDMLVKGRAWSGRP
jgi:ABC-type transporter Mla subunit MlaD